MRWSRFLAGAGLFAILVLNGAARTTKPAQEKDGASGTLIVNGQKIPLIHVAVDESVAKEIVVMLSDKPIPAEAVPFLEADFVKKQKVHAVVFTVARDTKKLARSFAGLYYPGGDTHFSGFAEGVLALTVKELDAGAFEGRIATSKLVELGSLQYSFDVSFQVALGQPKPKPAPPHILIKGDDTPPAKAYAQYHRVLFEGDVMKIRAFVVAKNLKSFDETIAKNKDAVIEFLKMRPASITIGKHVASGDQVSFTVNGEDASMKKAVSFVKMVLEGGAWKVLEDKWDIAYK